MFIERLNTKVNSINDRIVTGSVNSVIVASVLSISLFLTISTVNAQPIKVPSLFNNTCEPQQTNNYWKFPNIIAASVDEPTLLKTIKINNIRYTHDQQILMIMAHNIGAEFDFPETIQSLLIQETRAGLFGDGIGDIGLAVGKRSYGVMQMKVATTRKVLRNNKHIIANYFPNRKTYKKIRSEEIIIKLIQDDEFSIRMAAMNFKMHRDSSSSWAHAVVAYNMGQNGANRYGNHKKHKYYKQIVQKLINEIRPFNVLVMK